MPRKPGAHIQSQRTSTTINPLNIQTLRAQYDLWTQEIVRFEARRQECVNQMTTMAGNVIGGIGGGTTEPTETAQPTRRTRKWTAKQRREASERRQAQIAANRKAQKKAAKAAGAGGGGGQ
jgi:hypothetical protein